MPPACILPSLADLAWHLQLFLLFLQWELQSCTAQREPPPLIAFSTVSSPVHYHLLRSTMVCTAVAVTEQPTPTPHSVLSLIHI